MAANEESLYLRYLTYEGCRARYGIDIEFLGGLPVFGKNSPDTILRERIEHELDTIEKAGFPGYFLIVADILRFCRERNIPTGPGRGSICGSAVAYATYITDVEPIKFGIPFERFLHLERIAQPDIDLDICQVRRNEVIEHLRLTYGEDSVAQIITFTPLNAKGVVRDVCRVLHVDDILRGVKSNETGDKLATMVPEGSGADQVKLTELMESEEGAEFAKKLSELYIPFEGDRISIKETCLALEGLRRHGGVHAAGVVIADRPLIELAPLYKKNQDAEIQIQYDMRDAETVGLLKMDVLGLRTVTVLGEAERLVRRKIPDFNIKTVPLDDVATFSLLSEGDTGAVFQLEGDGITAACVGMRPDRFEDIIALIALYRPGPMEQLGSYFRRKHGEEPVEYAHPLLQSLLERTYGLMVYQEQVMGIVRAMAGYTAGEADQFRKAIGKKLVPMIREKIDEFIQRAISKGHDEALIRALGDQIFDFGRYGFNLGHATGYGFITYWTAYLKARHPAEFFTANLNSQVGVLDKIGTLLRDAESHGITVLPPDVNDSGAGFTLMEDGNIRFGIGAIKGIGDSAVKDILEERDSEEKNKYSRPRVTRTKPDGTPYQTNILHTERVRHVPRRYSDFWDFCNRLTHVPINAKKALVVAGAFGANLDERRALLSCIERVNEAAKSKRPYTVELDRTNAPSDIEILKNEKEVLGFYISGHPLAFYKQELERYGAIIDGALESLRSQCTVAGMVLGIRTHHSKNGEMAWVTLESGITGLPDITIFSSVWLGIQTRIKKDDVIVVHGNKRHDMRFGWGIIANDVIVINKSSSAAGAEQIHISIPDTDVVDLRRLALLGTSEGAVISVAVEDPTTNRIAMIATDLKILPTGANLKILEDHGWMIHIDPEEGAPLPWKSGKLTWIPATFSGSGSSRVPTWDLDMARRVIRILGGNVVAELRLQ
jgi:DNA polymerase-3 subunit alpha